MEQQGYEEILLAETSNFSRGWHRQQIASVGFSVDVHGCLIVPEKSVKFVDQLVRAITVFFGCRIYHPLREDAGFLAG
jgi:hypothetical protein